MFYSEYTVTSTTCHQWLHTFSTVSTSFSTVFIPSTAPFHYTIHNSLITRQSSKTLHAIIFFCIDILRGSIPQLGQNISTRISFLICSKSFAFRYVVCFCVPSELLVHLPWFLFQSSCVPTLKHKNWLSDFCVYYSWYLPPFSSDFKIRNHLNLHCIYLHSTTI